MKILVLESSGMVASVAVVTEEKLVGEYTTNFKKTHSQTLLPMMDTLLKMIGMPIREMDAIAACVVGGISFTGGIGKISGVVVGVFIFTALTYSLTILGIDTNLQFVFSGIIILVAVMLDCLKYVQKK